MRYVDRQGHTVIQRGNQRFVIHEEEPPRGRRRPHWLVISGLSLLTFVLLWWLLSLAVNWWTQNQLNGLTSFHASRRLTW